MKTLVIAAVIIALVGVVAYLAYSMKGPDLSAYRGLVEPKISTARDRKMLVYESVGDPNVVAGIAFSNLFKAFFKMKGKVDGLEMAAPRARWNKPESTPKNEWVGLYGLPLPDYLEKLPDEVASAGLGVRLETWKYGEVAEILHVGTYSSEEPTIKKLHDFIKSKGFVIEGQHEEEYVKGPGMFFRGNPDKYQTVIRYQVKPAR